MSVLIKGMQMPTDCYQCFAAFGGCCYVAPPETDGKCPPFGIGKPDWCPLVEIPPHGDLIDRDALIKDGWSNLYKEVMRMGGYAIHELPLKNPSIHVIIPAEKGEES